MRITILTSIHIFLALIVLPVGAIILTANPKKKEFQAISIFLFFLALSSFASGFELNAISFKQALPWIVVQIFTAYSISSGALLVALIVLRPNTAKKLWVSIPLWLLIVFPLVACLFDITNISQALFDTHLVINIAEISATYQGGYLSVTEAVTGPLYSALYAQLIGAVVLLLVYPLLVVAIIDRKTNSQNSKKALILLIFIGITAVFQAVFVNQFDNTITTLVANTLFAIGFALVGYQLISAEFGEMVRVPQLLQNYPMRYKLNLTLAIIILPAVVFISFITYSLFQTSMLSISAENLSLATTREAQIINTIIDDTFTHLNQVTDSTRIQNLLNSREEIYTGLNPEQINQQIAGREQLWQERNQLLSSAIMDTVNNPDIRNMMEEYHEISNIAIIDKYGALLTAGVRPDNYQFNDAVWWEDTITSRETQVGPIEFDPDSNHYFISLTMPIITEDYEVIGGLLATFNLEDIFTHIAEASGTSIEFALANSEAEIIPSSASPEEIFSLSQNAFTSSQADRNWQTTLINETPHLIDTARVFSVEKQFIAPWQVVAYEPVSVALSSLITARTGSILSSLVFIAFSAIIATVLTLSITEPLSQLTHAAEQMLAGNREISINVNSKDELGTLSATLNQMSAEISSLVQGLEGTIEERTQDLERRAMQMETAAYVAQQAGEIQDVSSLLDMSVKLISEKFGFYHTGIFLLDTQRQYAILAAANSEGGKRMLARGHKLQVGRVGVVGYCAGTGQPRIAQDVGADIVYYDNPDMPHTRSEMALPLTVRGEVIGVIDMQSTEASAFTQEDISVIQLLANQIALAIEKARLLEDSQKTLHELQKLYGEQAAIAWHQKLTGEKIAYQYNATGFTRTLKEGEKFEIQGRQLDKQIRYRGQVIGNLEFIRDLKDGNWSPDEEALIEDILEQTALALENARLVDQIKLRSDQIELLQEITALAASILDESLLLEEVARKLNTRLPNQECGIVLYDTTRKRSHLAARARMMELENSNSLGFEIPMDEDPYNLQDMHGEDAVVINNLHETSKYKTFINSFQIEGINSLVLLPLSIREQTAGYIYMAHSDPHIQIDPEESNLYRQIQAQISTAVESARLFAAEQQGREAAAALLEITQISSASLEINEVLNEATYRSAEAIQANRCTILLLDEHEKIKPLICVYSNGTQLEAEEWDTLVTKIQATYSDVPLRRLAASLRMPMTIDSPLTFEKFPLGWTQAFNIEKILMVPLISQNKVIGSMVYDHTSQEKSFSQSQIELAQTIAGQIATTLENATLFDQAIRRAERERQVTEITAKMRASNNPDEILETAITELRLALAKQEIQEKQKASSHRKKFSQSNGNAEP